jgi:hypothetical protein
MRRVSIRFCTLLCCPVVLAVNSCTGEPGVDKIATSLLLTAEQTEDPASSIISQQQRGFLRALTETQADPTRYMAAQFTMRDWAEAIDLPRRGLDGRSMLELDYWKVLSKRLPAEYAVVEQMEVTLQRPAARRGTAIASHAFVIVRHGAVRPTVTHWDKIGEEWKASWLTINVPEDVLTELSRRARRGS